MGVGFNTWWSNPVFIVTSIGLNAGFAPSGSCNKRRRLVGIKLVSTLGPIQAYVD
jgi:hypothetical protein